MCNFRAVCTTFAVLTLRIVQPKNLPATAPLCSELPQHYLTPR